MEEYILRSRAAGKSRTRPGVVRRWGTSRRGQGRLSPLSRRTLPLGAVASPGRRRACVRRDSGSELREKGRKELLAERGVIPANDAGESSELAEAPWAEAGCSGGCSQAGGSAHALGSSGSGGGGGGRAAWPGPLTPRHGHTPARAGAGGGGSAGVGPHRGGLQSRRARRPRWQESAATGEHRAAVSARSAGPARPPARRQR